LRKSRNKVAMQMWDRLVGDVLPIGRSIQYFREHGPFVGTYIYAIGRARKTNDEPAHAFLVPSLLNNPTRLIGHGGQRGAFEFPQAMVQINECRDICPVYSGLSS
jgi:hypothetical protein